MKTFQQWLKNFNLQEFDAFNADSSGVLWLKIKSIMRKQIIDFLHTKQALINFKQSIF